VSRRRVFDFNSPHRRHQKITNPTSALPPVGIVENSKKLRITTGATFLDKTYMTPIYAREITADVRDRLLSQDEDGFCDLKGIEVSPKSLSKSISAFANTAGGDLYIGIAEEATNGVKSRRWMGFIDVEAANGHLQSLETLFPLGAEYSYEFLRCPGSVGLVLHISVQRTVQIARTHDKKVYSRRGASCKPLDAAEIERLKLTKGIESYEKQTVDCNVASITCSEVIDGFLDYAAPNQDPLKFLTKQNLIRGDMPTVAGVLLFSDEPQAALPKRSAVKIYRYKTAGEASRETLDGLPKTIEGCITDLIKKSVYETTTLIEGIQKLSPHGLEQIKYPQETLHEIVTNAILHRDYSIAQDVHIRIFDNRVEVESPGLLPGQVTIKNFLDEQFARNPSLVRMANKFPNPPNKDVGEGLNTAFKAMQKLRLKPPTIEEGEHNVIVKIKHDPLASPEEMVMDYLENHAEIANRTARALTGITSENSMKDVFLRLQKSGLIERVPNRRGNAAAWQKQKK